MSEIIENQYPSSQEKDYSLLTGFVLLGISFAFFLFTANNAASFNVDFFSISFVVSYILFVIYFFVSGIRNIKDYGKFFKFKNLKRNILLLQLGNVSAYALNRTIAVFQISTGWLCWFLVLTNLALLGYCLVKDHKSNLLNHLMVFTTSVAMVFHLYQTIYVAPAYPISLMVFWLFGVSLHIFIPVWFFFTCIRILRKYFKTSSDYWRTTIAGIVLPLIIISVFAFRWAGINHQVSDVFHDQNRPYDDKELPNWVKVSQDLKKDWISKRILKSGMIYNTKGLWEGGGFMGGGMLNEQRQHDPLVVIAALVSGDLEISAEDRVKLLQSMYNQRHQTERKLWSGENLSTTDIVTNVQLFPEYRLAYTEKTFKIKNTQAKNSWRWGRQQEALYTFYLPEGSVVTSAALWVEGEERPAYLTTKAKADSAYTRIVGRERRDPLLLHWQEGNRVTVRVFPCTPEEDRQFKIGVTTPLQFQDGQLTYENVDFEGPHWRQAEESINVVVADDIGDISSPYSFREDGNSWTYKGNYKSDWTLNFDAPPLSKDAFTFNGRSFRLHEFQTAQTAFSAKEIYLDVHRGWAKKDLYQLWNTTKAKEVYVYTDHLEKVTETNHKRLFKKLLKRSFSLFPFHKIKTPESALVVSDYTARLTPTLDDLKKSSFAKNLNTFLKNNAQPVKFYNLGNDLSPYLKTLKELRVFDYANGNMPDLMTLLNEQQFYQSGEDEQTISNHYAQMMIREEAEVKTSSQAPDHLMRLFVYNDIMKKVGKGYFDKRQLEPQFIAAAKEAYVVTPISSLVVLETQKDYDRFNIKKSKNSLQNAKITNNDGSVPEPHEWLLIVLSLAVALWLFLKR